MSKKKLAEKAEEKIAINVETPQTDSKTAWEIVGQAVIQFIEPKPNNEWFTAKDVITNVLTGIDASFASGEKIHEIVGDVLTLLTAHHLLIVNGDKYRKFTLDEIVPNGIAIEKRESE